MADKIMLIRHAEKPGEPPPPFGVDETGQEDPVELVVRGWQRAGAIACLFAQWTAASRPSGLMTPGTIYATAAVHHAGRSLRPQHTVTPLAAVLNIAVDIQFALGDEADLAVAAQQGPNTVLIAWHHERIPGLANAILGNNTTCPQVWPDERFDVVWVFDRAPGQAGWQFSQVPQMLLAGDSPNPI
jgi:hypothetical protein